MDNDDVKDELKGLCMRCRDENKKPTMQVMKNIEISEKKNRYSAKGQCTKCDGNMFKFMSKVDAEALQQGSDDSMQKAA